MGPDAKILVFWMWVLSQLFHFPLSPLSGGQVGTTKRRYLMKHLSGQAYYWLLVVKIHLLMQVLREMQVLFLCQEDPLEEEMATHSSILVWKIQWTEEAGMLQSMGLQRAGYDWANEHACAITFMVDRDTFSCYRIGEYVNRYILGETCMIYPNFLLSWPSKCK